jgi:recombination protein RecT
MATTTGGSAKISQALASKISGGQPLVQAEFKDLMSKMRDEIALALPVHLKNNADRYARQMVQLFSQNPKLQMCRPVTILSAMMTASALGLELAPQLGQCYILPYENRKKDANNGWVTVTEAQFQLGYRGAIALAQRSNQILCIRAEVVHAKDNFKYSRGLHPMLEHVDSQEEDPGEVTHVYAVANFANGGYYFEVWPVAKVFAHAKKFSKSYYRKDRSGALSENPNSPWVADFEAMAKKTLILAIWKYLPVSTEILLAGATDETIRDDVAGVESEKDVITLPTIGMDAPGDMIELQEEPAPDAPSEEKTE